jgi:hypothetical protein
MSLVLQSSGGGQITIQEPATASNFTQTLPAATGEIMVSGAMLAFRAYVNNAQGALTTSTSVQMQLNVASFDTASRFNATGSTVGGIPAYSFLPNVAGYYSVNASVYVTPDVVNITVAEPIIYKNGAAHSNGTFIPIAGSSLGTITNCADLIYMNGTTDYLSFYCFATTSSGTWTLRNGAATSFVSAVLVRSA